MSFMSDYIDLSEVITAPGQPSPDQMSYMDDLPEGSKVIGWHRPTNGPLIVKPDGEWIAVRPTGTARRLVSR